MNGCAHEHRCERCGKGYSCDRPECGELDAFGACPGTVCGGTFRVTPATAREAPRIVGSAIGVRRTGKKQRAAQKKAREVVRMAEDHDAEIPSLPAGAMARFEARMQAKRDAEAAEAAKSERQRLIEAEIAAMHERRQQRAVSRQRG